MGLILAQNFFGTTLGSPTQGLGDVNLHYGILHGGAELYERCRKADVDFVHVDHGFWNRNTDLNKAQGSFRFSLNSQAQLYKEPKAADWSRMVQAHKDGHITLGREVLHPSFENRRIFYYQPPSPFMRAYYKLPDDFDAERVKILMADFPEYEIRLWEKGSGDLDRALNDCACFVSFNSAAGIRALDRGIPAIMTAPETFWTNDKLESRLDFIGRRDRLFASLAGRCFDISEMKDGTAIFHMLANGEIP
jgi:hypothetical protein